MTTIVFPTLTRAAPQSLELGLKANTQVFVSELSGDVQTLELPGARWTMSFSFSALERADAGIVEALFASMRGQANRLQVPVFGRSVPRGTWAGTPKVTTGAQTGNTLDCYNFAAGATVKKGDLFNVGSAGELKIITADGTADGSGLLTLTFEPPLRASPSADEFIISNSCVVPLMIPSDPHLKTALSPGDFTDAAFDLVEVFA